MDNRLSNFNTVLEQVLNFTQATYDEFAAANEGTVEHHIIRGKLLALNQVIEFFRSVDEKGLAPGVT